MEQTPSIQPIESGRPIDETDAPQPGTPGPEAPSTATATTDHREPETGEAGPDTPPSSSNAPFPPPPAPGQAPTRRRLTRGEGPVAGVAGGLADYFNLDPSLVRLGLVAATLVTGPGLPVAYLAAWFVVPRA